jgi:hypothetical protein
MAARRPTFLPLVVGALALAAVVVLFQSILEPVTTDGCNTSLVPSTFATVLGPAHLAAAVVLAACIWAMSGPRPGPWIRRGLAAALTYALACAAVPGVFAPAGFVVVFATPVLGPLALLALLIRTVVTARSGWVPAERAAAHAETARWLLWLGLLLGLPASASFAWLSGVSLLCF